MIKRLLLSIGVIVFFLLTGSLFAQTYEVPEILYYKFENNGPSNTPNYAIPGAGTNPAVITGQAIGPGGQFGVGDSALIGNGGPSGSNNLNTGWNIDVTGSWTISFWVNNYSTSFTGYFFGSPTGLFRSFTNGAAGSTNITLRGTGIANVDVVGVLPGPFTVHFVYDSVASNIKAYVDGVLHTTVSQGVFNIAATGPFRVGAWTAGNSIAQGSILDEFRFYSRALDSAEIANTWNQQLPHTVTGIQNISTIATDYKLSQNYPNPFNPSTQIDFSIPEGGYTKLEIYNSLGQVVNTLVSRDLSAGSYTATFDGSGLSSGIYFYKLQSGEFSTVKKMNLIK